MLRAIAASQPAWAAWQPAVMLPDGRINTSGGVVHFIGLGWAGQCGEPASALPDHPHEVAFASGAALVIRRQAWEAVGGFEDSYFLYGEDLDLGLRLWLAGYRVGIEPRARVTHDYEFDKGEHKWYLLERNRWSTCSPIIRWRCSLHSRRRSAVSELGLLAVAARDRWLRAKLCANLAVLRSLPRVLARRRRVQSLRKIGAATFAERLTSSLENPYLRRPPGLLVAVQAAYFAFVRLLLRASVSRPC